MDETRKGRNIHLMKMCIDLVKTSLLLCRRSIRGWWLWVSGTVTPRSGTWTPTPPWTRAWWCRWWASCPTTCSPWGSSCRPSCWRRRFVVLPNLLRVRFLVNVWNDVVVCFFFRAPLQTNSTSTTTCFVTRTRCSATLILSPPKVRWFVYLKTVHASTGFTFLFFSQHPFIFFWDIFLIFIIWLSVNEVTEMRSHSLYHQSGIIIQVLWRSLFELLCFYSWENKFKNL